MPIVRWALGWLLTGLFVSVCVCKVALVRRSIRRKEHHSLIPLIGALFGVVGFLALPLQAAHRFFWLPCIADLGTIVCFAAVGDFIARKLFRL